MFVHWESEEERDQLVRIKRPEEKKARNIGIYTLVFTGGREDDILM